MTTFKQITGRLWMALRADGNVLISDDGDRYGAAGFPVEPEHVVIERADLLDLITALQDMWTSGSATPAPDAPDAPPTLAADEGPPRNPLIVDIDGIEVTLVGDWCELNGRDDDGARVRMRLHLRLDETRALARFLYREVRVTISAPDGSGR